MRMLRIVAGVLGALAVLPVVPVRAALAQEVIALQGGTVIDGTGAPPIPDAVVVVRGDRIEAIGPGLKPPDGARIVDVTGMFITPGLWDKHFHYKDWFPELVVSSGVTSAWVQAGGPWINAQKEGIAKGKILGPRMFLRQESVDMWDSPDEARQRTRRIIESGADFVKVYTGVTAEILKAVAEEAHKAGLIVEGHLGIGARAAAEAGIDGLTHCTGIALDTVRPEDLARVPEMTVVDTGRQRVIFPRVATWNESRVGGPNPDLSEYWLFLEDPRHLMLFGMMDRGLARNLIDLLIKEEVFIESCLGYVFRHVHDRVEAYRAEDHLLLSDPNLHYIPELIKFNVLDYSLLDQLTSDEIELMQRGYRNFQWFVKTFVDAGGRMVVGPDTTSNNHATMLPGVATRREMQLLVDAGLTPAQALKAATLWPAQVLGKHEDLGTLEKGKVADLVALAANPIEDIAAFGRIGLVMQGGRMLPVGYHYDFVNPIPWPVGNDVEFPGHGPVSEIPQVITRLTPSVVVEGSGDVTLTIEGREFVSTSTVKIGDQLLRTELVDSTRLKAVVPARLLAQVGTHPIKVVHRLPAWGETNTVYLVVKFR